MNTVGDDPPADYVALFDLERRELLELLGDLRDGDWRRPTPCPRWSVQDLSCHLLGDDFGLLARSRDGHFGTQPPPDATGDESFAVWLDSLQDAWVVAGRRLSPRLIVELLSWTGRQVIDLLKGMDASARSARVSWAGPDPVPSWLDQAREVSEQWIHRQQLRMAVDLSADLVGAAAGPVLDAMRWAYPYRLSFLDLEEGSSVGITVTGVMERNWVLEKTSIGWCFVEPGGHPTVGDMEVSSEDAWRLLTNNLGESERSRIKTTGDRSVSEALLFTRAIIGVPKFSTPQSPFEPLSR